MQEQYHKWYAQYLGRDMEMLVFGTVGIPVILFPTEKGRFFDAKDFGIISSAEEILEERKIKIYCPNSIDGESWYNYDAEPSKRIENHLAYEGSIIKDVIEFAKHETQHERVILASISFGGYQALNLTFKYPELVSADKYIYTRRFQTHMFTVTEIKSISLCNFLINSYIVNKFPSF